MKCIGEVFKGLVKEFFIENILLVGYGVLVIGIVVGLVGEIVEIEFKVFFCCLVKIVL